MLNILLWAAAGSCVGFFAMLLASWVAEQVRQSRRRREYRERIRRLR